MKTIIIVFISIISTGLSSQNVTLHDFTVKDIYDDEYNLSQLHGKKVMVVNTASKCGLTPQYKELQELYDKYKDNNFMIIGFPANNFLNQEPGTEEEIVQFCEANYGVTFPMMSKISVKGDDIHEVYQWLTSKEKNGKMSSKVKWNFQKYLIDENGMLVDVLNPKENPKSQKVIDWIENTN